MQAVKLGALRITLVESDVRCSRLLALHGVYGSGIAGNKHAMHLQFTAYKLRGYIMQLADSAELELHG